MASYVRQRPAGWFWLVGLLITGWGAFACTTWLLAQWGIALGQPQAAAGWGYGLVAGSVLGGGIAVLNKRAVARAIFAVTLALAAVETVWLLAVTRFADPGGAAFTLAMLAGAALLVWFANYSRRHGWIC